MKLNEIKEKLKTHVDEDLSMYAHRGWGCDNRHFDAIVICEYNTLAEFHAKEYNTTKYFYENIYLDFEEGKYGRLDLTRAELKLEDFNEWLNSANPDHYYKFAFESGDDHGTDTYELKLVGVDGDYVIFDSLGEWYDE